jgi:hypothetical protein
MRLTMIALLASLASIGTVVATPAWAHDQASGPNGGQVVTDGNFHVEFTAKPDQIVLFLLDVKDLPLTSANATGRVISLAGTTQSTLELTATAPNLLVAKLASPLAPATKVIVSIKLPDGQAISARFVTP